MEHELQMVGFWEKVATRREMDWKEAWGSADPQLRESVYWKDVFPYKALARSSRLQAGQMVCQGAIDCLERPLTKCMAGKHDTCRVHSGGCFYCKTEAP